MDILHLKHPTVSYVAPFAVFIVLLGLRSVLPLPPSWEYPFQFLVTAGVLILTSWRLLLQRPTRLFQSIAIGVVVFLIWIIPDLISSTYRSHWIFQNSFTGAVASSVSDDMRGDSVFLIFRILGTVMLVPIIEELFWRGWLMRYIIKPDFETVPLGTYTLGAFWITAVLFASEHGPYWDVGLLAGIVFNIWIIRTRNLMDCIVAHAASNACLAAYVLVAGQWQYWL